MSSTDKLFLALAAFAVLVVVGITAHSFLILGNHDYVVEAPCDSETETCFYRDCSEEDSCPPNGLEYYRIFTLSAADFALCADNSCLIECMTSKATCEEVACGESEEDSCSLPTPQVDITDEGV